MHASDRFLDEIDVQSGKQDMRRRNCGLGIGGAMGAMVGAVGGMGFPEYEAKHYEERVNDGGTLVSVYCESSEEISVPGTC